MMILPSKNTRIQNVKYVTRLHELISTVVKKNYATINSRYHFTKKCPACNQIFPYFMKCKKKRF